MSILPICYDNIIFSLQRAGGISLYWFELIKRMAIDNRLQIHKYRGADRNIFRKQLNGIDFNSCEQKIIPVNLVRFLPFVKKIQEPSIFHSSYYRISTNKNAANIVTVHDFTYEKFLRKFYRFPHFWQKKATLEKADGIICVSESTKKDLLHFFPHLSNKNISVIYHGVSKTFKVTTQKTTDKLINKILSSKYIVFIGSRISYKNFSIAIRLLSELPDFHLVIIGGGALSPSEHAELNEKLGEKFVHFEDVNSSLLNVMYNNAFCLLYPSSYEGFGLPVLEAMNAGCPVIAVNVSSLPEVCGPAGLMVESPNVNEIKYKIRLLNNMSFRQEIIEKGLVQAKKFKWGKCALKTREFYNEVFENKFSH